MQLDPIAIHVIATTESGGAQMSDTPEAHAAVMAMIDWLERWTERIHSLSCAPCRRRLIEKINHLEWEYDSGL